MGFLNVSYIFCVLLRKPSHWEKEKGGEKESEKNSSFKELLGDIKYLNR